MGQLDEAVADFKKALELNSDVVAHMVFKPNLCDAGAASGCFA